MTPSVCPACNADLRGDLIPEEHREFYAEDRFSRVIGVYSLGEDRIVEWRCPDCQHQWPRLNIGSA